MNTQTSIEFRTLFSGRLSGLLKWDQVDALFALIAEGGEDWYLYRVSEGLPEAPLSGEELGAKLKDIRDWAFIQNKKDPLCGCVFVNDREDPAIVKIYDPASGSSCSVTTPLPVYTLSRSMPEKLPFEAPEAMFDDGSGVSIFDRLLRRGKARQN